MSAKFARIWIWTVFVCVFAREGDRERGMKKGKWEKNRKNEGRRDKNRSGRRKIEKKEDVGRERAWKYLYMHIDSEWFIYGRNWLRKKRDNWSGRSFVHGWAMEMGRGRGGEGAKMLGYIETRGCLRRRMQMILRISSQKKKRISRRRSGGRCLQ